MTNNHKQTLSAALSQRGHNVQRLSTELKRSVDQYPLVSQKLIKNSEGVVAYTTTKSNKGYSRGRKFSKKKTLKKVKSDVKLRRDVKRAMFEFQSGMLRNPFNQVKGTCDKVDNLTDTVNSLLTPENVDKFNGVINDVTGLVSEFKDKNLLDKCDDMSTSVTSLMETFASATKAGKDTTFYCLTFLAASQMIYYGHSRSKVQLIIAALALIVSTQLVPEAMKSTFMEYLLKCLPAISTAKNDIAEAQMGTPELENLAFGLVSALAVKNGVSSKANITKLTMDYLKDKDRMVTSLADAVKRVLEFGQYLANLVAVKCKSDKLFNFIQTNSQEIDSFSDRVMEIERKIHLKKFAYTLENYETLVDLGREADKLIKGLPRGPKSVGILSLLNAKAMALSKFRNLFSNSGFTSDGLRPEPVGMLVRGEPGIGKSQMMTMFNYALCKATLPADSLERFNANKTRFIYERQQENEYWDGYTSDAHVCIFDDLGQIRDSVAAPNPEWMNIIRAVNEVPYILHMARVEDKANSYFTSSFVIATTNWKGDLPIDSICEPEAVNRRFDFDFIQEVVPKYADEFKRIDKSKLPMGSEGVTSFTPEMVRFKLLKPANGNAIGTYTFDEVLQMLVDMHYVKRARYKQRVADMVPFLDRINNLAEPQGSFLSKNKGESYIGDERFQNILRTAQIHEDIPEDIAVTVNQNLAIVNSLWHAISGTNFGLADRIRIFCSVTKDDGMLMLPHSEFQLEFATAIGEFDFEEGDFTLKEIHIPKSTSLASRVRGIFVGLKDRVKNGFTTAIEWLTSHMSTILTCIGWLMAVLGVGLVVKAAPKIYKSYQEIKVEELAAAKLAEQHSFGHSDKLRMPAKASSITKLTLKTQMGSGFDTGADVIIDRILNRSSYEFLVQDGDSFRKAGYATFVKGRLAVVPAHFIGTFANNVTVSEDYLKTVVKIRKSASDKDGDRCYLLTVKDIFAGLLPNDEINDSCLGRDWIVFQAPNNVPVHPNIIKYFASEAHHRASESVMFRLVAANLRREEATGQATRLKSAPVRHGTDSIGGQFELSIADPWSYSATTVKGDCGALFCVLNRRSDMGTIYGFHVAGDTGRAIGFSTPIYKETLESLVVLFDVQADSPLIDEESYIKDCQPQGDIPEKFELLYSVKSSIFSGSKSKIVPSKLHPLFSGGLAWKTDTTAVARLGRFTVQPGDKVIDPFQNTLSKYCSSKPIYFGAELANASESYYQYLLANSDIPVTARMYDFEEACKGLDGDSDFSSMSRSTSPGFPFILETNRGKTKYFGDGQDWDLGSEEAKLIKRRVWFILDEAKAMRRHIHVFTDNLKDERRPKDKVAAGKTRMISGCPMDLLIAYRMMFGAFSLWYMKNRINNGSAIGVNPYSQEWHHMALKMRQKAGTGARCGAGDYSAFDASGLPQVYFQILGIINSWYNDGPDNANIREILWLELVNSRHIRGDTIYAWHSSLPSGHPLTALVNTMYNHIAFRMAWQLRYGVSIMEANDFNNHVYLCCLGDDNIFAVSPLRDDFTEEAIALVMSKVGLTYTSELKGESHAQLRKLEDLQFLKRTFRFEPISGVYVAPLSLDVVLETPYWTKKCGVLQDDIVHTNVQGCLDELSLHGSSVFAEYAPQVNLAYKSMYGRTVDRTCFNSCYAFVCNCEGVYIH